MFVESLFENLEDFCIIRKFKNENDFMVHYSSQNKQQLINRLRRIADWV